MLSCFQRGVSLYHIDSDQQSLLELRTNAGAQGDMSPGLGLWEMERSPRAEFLLSLSGAG